MKPLAAVAPPSARDDRRMLVLDLQFGQLEDRHVRQLPQLLSAGDLLVVNDAATLPASLAARTTAGAGVELRLLAPELS